MNNTESTSKMGQSAVTHPISLVSYLIALVYMTAMVHLVITSIPRTSLPWPMLLAMPLGAAFTLVVMGIMSSYKTISKTWTTGSVIRFLIFRGISVASLIMAADMITASVK